MPSFRGAALPDLQVSPDFRSTVRSLDGSERRGRDLNPRRTEPPETVFETAAFDRSATPPRRLTA
jgi:hypothetical protein